MEYTKSIPVPGDLDERIRLIASLDGRKVEVTDVNRLPYSPVGKIHVSTNGSHRHYFLRGDKPGDSMVLDYADLRGLRIFVRFASDRRDPEEDGELEAALV